MYHKRIVSAPSTSAGIIAKVIVGGGGGGVRIEVFVRVFVKVVIRIVVRFIVRYVVRVIVSVVALRLAAVDAQIEFIAGQAISSSPIVIGHSQLLERVILVRRLGGDSLKIVLSPLLSWLPVP